MRTGFGMPLRFVLPSRASANIVSISDSNCRAGLTSQWNMTGSSPSFQNLWAVPASTMALSPEHEADALAADAQVEHALDRGERLGLAGMHVRGGDEATGLDDGDELDVFAAGGGGGLEEGQLLAGHAVDESVSGVDHDGSLSTDCAARRCTTNAARGHVRRT